MPRPKIFSSQKKEDYDPRKELLRAKYNNVPEFDKLYEGFKQAEKEAMKQYEQFKGTPKGDEIQDKWRKMDFPTYVKEQQKSPGNKPSSNRPSRG